MLRPPSHELGLKWLALLALSLGCQPKIGEDCSIGTDCSQTGSRTCDATMPHGYCTIYNCEPDKCPSEAACIGFAISPSTVSLCASTSETRQLRTFCMRRCSSDGDCRSGYACLDLNEEGNPWNAALMDEKRSSGKVCTVAYSAMPAVEDKDVEAAYCTSGAYEDNGYYDVSSGSGGGGGQSSSAQGGEASQGGSNPGSSVSGVAGQAGATAANSTSTVASP